MESLLAKHVELHNQLDNELHALETNPNKTINHHEILNRIGHLTRELHHNFVEIGFEDLLGNASIVMPNTVDRLNYVVKMTEEAASKVLNAVDITSPLQSNLIEKSHALQAQLLHVKNHLIMPIGANNDLVTNVINETILFLKMNIETAEITKQQLQDIMMAQDFQDLTGQVIKKTTELVRDVEQQLLQVLVDFKPTKTNKHEAENSLLNGPQINPQQTVNIVADQKQVDDLLDSLGF